MTLTDRQLRDLLRACRETHAEEMDCEEFLAVMAQFIEVRREREHLPEALKKAEEHVRLCANCREECEALLAALRLDSSPS